MKRILLSGLAVCLLLTGIAQSETNPSQTPPAASDTIQVGGMTIIRKPGSYNQQKQSYHSDNIKIQKRKYRQQNVTTNWGILDLGFAAYNDQTNYPAQAFAPSSTEDWFDLRSGKSVNVNIWLFMQRLNLIRHVVNLKYGFGIDLNNYHFDDERVRFHKNPTYVSLDDKLAGAKKNKLAADYVTVPMMLNFNFTPQRREGFGFSAGVSAGFLYNARQKVKIGNDKTKLHNDFDLEDWKLSYVGELLLGPVKLYGSYAMNNMWEKGLDMTPYSVGIRFSNW
jgi:hypothetical protein